MSCVLTLLGLVCRWVFTDCLREGENRYKEIVEIYHANLATRNPKAAAEYPVDRLYRDVCLTLACLYPAILPPFLAGAIAGADAMQAAAPEKYKYTFEVFYNLWMGRVVAACNTTNAFDLLEEFEAGKYS